MPHSRKTWKRNPSFDKLTLRINNRLVLREQFIGRNPTHFIASPIVKAFIISELFLWSSWYAIIPIFGVFVVKDVPGGNIELAASGYSVYLVSRVIFELVCGKTFSNSSEHKKLYVSIFGLILAGLGTLAFALTKSLALIFIAFGIIGLGIGIASPVKNSLFSTHLDKNKETTEWGIYDAVVYICIALSTALGGFIAAGYGFQIFFVIAGIWMLLGVLPYLLYLKRNN